MLRALLFAVLVIGLARRLRDHGIDHLRDHALLGDGQRFDLFELLTNLVLRRALLRCCHGGCGVVGDRRNKCGVQGLYGHRQQRHLHNTALARRIVQNTLKLIDGKN